MSYIHSSAYGLSINVPPFNDQQCKVQKLLDANATSLIPSSLNSPSFALNPYVSTFVPNHVFNFAIIASFATLLILCAFLFNAILTINNMQNNDGTSPRDLLKKLKLTNTNRIMIGHLNINSIRNKFESVMHIIEENVAIILFSETKLNDTFPESQFLIEGFHVPYRLDRTDKGGGILLFVRAHIPSRKINVKFSPKIEAIVIEINLKKKKWLLIGSYNPHKNMIGDHLNCIGNYLNEASKRYENFIIIGDLNSETEDDAMQEFCSVYNFKNVSRIWIIPVVLISSLLTNLVHFKILPL